MSRPGKRTLFIAFGTVGLLILGGWAALRFVDVTRFKPELEAAASKGLGMDFRVGGRLTLGYFRGFRLTAQDGRVLDKRGVVVASAKRVRLWIHLLPLLRSEFRPRRIELTQPTLSLERGSAGGLDVEKVLGAIAIFAAQEDARLTISDGTVVLADHGSGTAFKATGLDLDIGHVRLAGGMRPGLLKGLSLDANVACRDLHTRNLSLSDLKATIHGKDGVLAIEPLTLRMFEGQVTANVQADFSGTVPVGKVHFSLPRFRIEEFLKTVSPQKAVVGPMDFSANLAMRGNTVSQWKQSAAGEMSLRGENLALEGNDIDKSVSRFESSQSFSLVDVGAVFFAGPVGLAVTRGYKFSSLFLGSGGSSKIARVVSEWQVAGGVAEAKDVALATPENRIALQGGLDFVRGQFADVTVAVVDAKGCATVQQVIHGSFSQPSVEKPKFLKSLAGPLLKLYRKTRSVFPQAPCTAFYSGSVAAPH